MLLGPGLSGRTSQWKHRYSQGNGLKCGEKHRKVDGSHVVVGADETDYLLQSFRARRLKAVGALRSVWELQIKGVMIIDDFTFM